MIEVGDRVRWVGRQDVWCAPGRHGTVLAIAHHDEDSFKVLWDERIYCGPYTWERRKNLRSDGPAPVMAMVAA